MKQVNILIAFCCSSDVNLPFDIPFRFDLNKICSFLAFSSFNSPDLIFLKSFILLLKLANLFLKLISLK